MLEIETNVELPPVSSDYQKQLQGKSPEYIQIAWNRNKMFDAKRKIEIAQAIIDYCQKYTNLKLDFKQWVDDNIVANDEVNNRYVIVGSWNNSNRTSSRTRWNYLQTISTY